MADTDKDYVLPLKDQRVFGAGIKRKKINFVPESTSDPSVAAIPINNSTNVGSRYLSIVLPKSSTDTAPESPASAMRDDLSSREPSPPATNLCNICSLPLSTSSTHESSIAHQLCLTHVQPPSHLPRSHIGVRYLTTHGWDPDARRGLGSAQQGITVPIKAKEKKDTAGLRERVAEDERPLRKKAEKKEDTESVVKSNGKQARVKDLEAKKRAERLRASIYGPDLEKYLGSDAAQHG